MAKRPGNSQHFLDRRAFRFANLGHYKSFFARLLKQPKLMSPGGTGVDSHEGTAVSMG
jgi:hypothetical protein